MVGKALGEPGATVGPAVTGAVAVGVALGDPGATAGPGVGPTVTGAAVMGKALGDPGITLGPVVDGAEEGVPGAIVGQAVTGTTWWARHWVSQRQRWARPSLVQLRWEWRQEGPGVGLTVTGDGMEAMKTRHKLHNDQLSNHHTKRFTSRPVLQF